MKGSKAETKPVRAVAVHLLNLCLVLVLLCKKHTGLLLVLKECILKTSERQTASYEFGSSVLGQNYPPGHIG